MKKVFPLIFLFLAFSLKIFFFRTYLMISLASFHLHVSFLASDREQIYYFFFDTVEGNERNFWKEIWGFIETFFEIFLVRFLLDVIFVTLNLVLFNGFSNKFFCFIPSFVENRFWLIVNCYHRSEKFDYEIFLNHVLTQYFS